MTTQRHRTTNNSITTTTSTLTNLNSYNMAATNGQTAIGTAYISAYEPAIGDYKLWTVPTINAIKLASSTTPQGSPGVPSAHSSTAGAASWTCTTLLNATGSIEVNVTGEAGKTINWVGVLDLFCIDHTVAS